MAQSTGTRTSLLRFVGITGVPARASMSLRIAATVGDEHLGVLCGLLDQPLVAAHVVSLASREGEP